MIEVEVTKRGEKIQDVVAVAKVSHHHQKGAELGDFYYPCYRSYPYYNYHLYYPYHPYTYRQPVAGPAHWRCAIGRWGSTSRLELGHVWRGRESGFWFQERGV